MGSFGLLLIPALGGYLFLIRFNGTRDRIGRQSGYHVVFKAAVIGVVLFAAARVLVLALNDWLPVVAALWRKAIDLQYSGTATLSVLLGWLSPFVANLVLDRIGWRSRRIREQIDADRLAARREIAAETGDHIGLVVDEAFRRSTIEATLTSGKVYVGVPLARTFVARGEGGDLVLLPLYSGYRHKDTHDVKLTVNYAPVLLDKRRQAKRRQDKLDVRSFRIALRMDEIVTARPFDRGSYRQFADIRRQAGIDDIAA